MTDAHCHVSAGEPGVRELLAAPCQAEGRSFAGVHPWDAAAWSDAARAALRARLAAEPRLGVGETGLDRLKSRDISAAMRAAFSEQLALAAEFARPVVLHGAKCWGEVVKAVRPFAGRIPAFLFHGFSRSDGLLPDIVALNGYVSAGPQILNGHAVNYRALVAKIPVDRLLAETDRTRENAATCPSVRDIVAFLARQRGCAADEMERLLDANAERFLSGQ